LAGLEELNAKIEELRNHMNRLIELKEDTLDSEVIYISKKLDTILNEYEEEIKKKGTYRKEAF
jgi:stage 0 sporulation regulatory protein